MDVQPTPLYGNSILEFQTHEWKSLQKIFDIVSDNASEVLLRFRKDGVQFFCDDGTERYVIECRFESDHFSHYFVHPDVLESENMENFLDVGIDVNTMYNGLRSLNNKETLTVSRHFDEDGNPSNYIVMLIRYDETDEEEVIRLPIKKMHGNNENYEIDFSADIEDAEVVSVPTDTLKNICTKIKNLGVGKVTVTYIKGNNGRNLLKFESDKKNTVDFCRRICIRSAHNLEETEKDNDDEGTIIYRESFAQDIFNKLSKCNNLGGSKLANIHFANDNDGGAFNIIFNIGSTGEFRFYIAPAETDNDEDLQV